MVNMSCFIASDYPPCDVHQLTVVFKGIPLGISCLGLPTKGINELLIAVGFIDSKRC
jgi:hypothetical protein